MPYQTDLEFGNIPYAPVADANPAAQASGWRVRFTDAAATKLLVLGKETAGQTVKPIFMGSQYEQPNLTVGFTTSLETLPLSCSGQLAPGVTPPPTYQN